MKMIVCLVSLGVLLSACAADPSAPDRPVYQAPSTQTGSRLPPKRGEVQTMSQEELERMRQSTGQPTRGSGM